MANEKIKIALIICSTRTPRVGPAIASWVTSLLSASASEPPILPRSTILETLDLASVLGTPDGLPISPSGLLPAQMPVPLPPNSYPSAAVNAWSATISSFSAFIFLTPQYNWSFPASVKIAIDHLFHEWANKPSFVISYGGRGGGKANTALRDVLIGIRALPLEAGVELPISGIPGGIDGAVKGVLEAAVVEAWLRSGKGLEVRRLVGELVQRLGGRAE